MKNLSINYNIISHKMFNRMKWFIKFYTKGQRSSLGKQHFIAAAHRGSNNLNYLINWAIYLLIETNIKITETWSK